MTAKEVGAWARKAREATLQRDAAIRRMRDEGSTLRVIADAAGLTHTAVAKILGRGNYEVGQAVNVVGGQSNTYWIAEVREHDYLVSGREDLGGPSVVCQPSELRIASKSSLA